MRRLRRATRRGAGGAGRARGRSESAAEEARARPSSASSSPGQSTPAPSAAQKMPKVVSSRPTANLIAFSGTRSSGARTSTPRRRRPRAPPPRRPTAEPKRPWAAPKRDDDEGDLEALEQDALERDRERVPVEPGRSARPAARGLLALLAEGLLLVVQRLVAARAQDRLAQPLQPEDEQQRADDQPQRVDRDSAAAPGRARRQRRERERRCGDADQRRAPAAYDARRRARSSAPRPSRPRWRGRRRGTRKTSGLIAWTDHARSAETPRRRFDR